jgi:hypothetical protein
MLTTEKMTQEICNANEQGQSPLLWIVNRSSYETFQHTFDDEVNINGEPTILGVPYVLASLIDGIDFELVTTSASKTEESILEPSHY